MKKIDGDWYKLNAELVMQAQIVIVLGFSPGSMIELAFAKYVQKYLDKKMYIFIDERCIKQKLPESFHEQIKNINYCSSIDELRKKLKEV